MTQSTRVVTINAEARAKVNFPTKQCFNAVLEINQLIISLRKLRTYKSNKLRFDFMWWQFTVIQIKIHEFAQGKQFNMLQTYFSKQSLQVKIEIVNGAINNIVTWCVWEDLQVSGWYVKIFVRSNSDHC